MIFWERRKPLESDSSGFKPCSAVDPLACCGRLICLVVEFNFLFGLKKKKNGVNNGCLQTTVKIKQTS